MTPYLALCREDSAQRDYPLPDVFNALRYVVRTGCQWRYLSNDLPPWNVVHQQAQRWIGGCSFRAAYICNAATPGTAGYLSHYHSLYSLTIAWL